MLYMVLGFATTTAFIWVLVLILLQVFRVFDLILRSNYFTARVNGWKLGWKSWAFVAGFVFVC